jgi:chemotaxis protein CheX
MDKDTIVNAVRESTDQVFSTMLAMDITPGEPYTEGASASPSDGLVSFIGLAGDWIGTGSLTCSASLACRVCSQFLMGEYPAVDEDVLDAFAELTNMIIGNAKTILERHLGHMGLSIPTVIFGKNFETKSVRSTEWVVVPFTCEGEDFNVKVCLTPNGPPPRLMPSEAAHPYSLRP